jgi:hypothetical protein
MTLSTGDRLGRYEILGILGAGGMGEVYRALDTELDREVAVKVLAEAVAGNPERIARFEREARVLASLSHQNIATLYGLEEHDGQRFLVMELALGETLDEHLQKKNVPVDEALEIALEIAAGLEAAHVTGQMTEAGVLLGTVSYMSPEQARGRRVDNRTDIWAFGCLLFEMLSGEKPFQGETITDTLAAVVTHEPEWDRLHDATPPAVRRLLRRCLQKAPGRRLHAIADARIEIEDAVSEPARAYHSSPVTDAGSRSGATAPRAAALALAGAIVGGALAAGAVWYASRTDEAAAPRGPLPVVFLMDTLAPYGVYDAETRNNAGTNADDLNGLLRDLPIEIHKETLGSRWDREDQILKQRPDLIVVHRSAFYHSINLELGYGYPPFDDPVIEARAYRVYEIVLGKLIAFFGYVGMGDPHTKFLVYSRGAPPGWIEEQQRAFVAEAERRYPHLKGRVFTFQVPRNAAGESSFRDPTTGEAIRKRIVVLLELEDRGPEPR